MLINLPKLISEIYRSPLLFRQKVKLSGLALAGNEEHRMRIFLFLKGIKKKHKQIQREEKRRIAKIPKVLEQVKNILHTNTKQILSFRNG